MLKWLGGFVSALLVVLFGVLCFLYGQSLGRGDTPVAEPEPITLSPAPINPQPLPFEEPPQQEVKIELEPAPPQKPEPAPEVATEAQAPPEPQDFSLPPRPLPPPEYGRFPQASVPAKSTPYDNAVVCLEGSKFHRPDCRALSSTNLKSTLAQARSQGYTPCDTCDPLSWRGDSIIPAGIGTPHKVFVPKNPRGEAESLEMLFNAMEQAPDSFKVEITWVDPFTDKPRFLEYRRDTQTLTRYDDMLWEQWAGITPEGVHAGAMGEPLSLLGVYTFRPIKVPSAR
jgi:hypothetical protein